MALTETKRRTWRTGMFRWRVLRIFRCPNSEAEGHEASLWDEPAPGYSGVGVPLCRHIETTPNVGTAGRAEIRATYVTPTWRASALQNKNQLLLDTASASLGQAAKKDLYGQVVKGRDPLDHRVHRWEVVDGESTLVKPIMSYTAWGLVDDDHNYVEKYTEFVGCANSNTMSKFKKHSGVKQLLLKSLVAKPHRTADGYWWVWYHFWGRGDGWTETCTVEKFEQVACDVDVVDANGVKTGGTRKGLKWQPVDPVETATCSFYPLANFSAINNIIAR